MALQKKIHIILFLLALIAFSGAVYAEEAASSLQHIETFSDYIVDINLLGNGSARITHTITIKNNDSVSPIVPGIAYLNVFKNGEENNAIRELEVNLSDGTPIVKFVKENKDYFEIRYELWFPLGSKKTTTVIISYTMDEFYPKKAFFYEIKFPIGNSSIPLEKAKILLRSNNVSISHADGSVKETKQGLEWSLSRIDVGDTREVNFEYTSLPFPRLPLKGVFIFWSLLTITGLGIIAAAALFLRKKKLGRGAGGGIGK